MGRVAERFRRRRRYKQFAWAADECLRASRVFAEDMGVNDWWKLRANDLYEDARQLWSEWQEMCRRDQVRIGMAVLRQIYDEAARKEYEAAAEKVFREMSSEKLVSLMSNALERFAGQP